MRAIVAEQGVRAGLVYLNGLTEHRFTAVYRFDGDTLRNAVPLRDADGTPFGTLCHFDFAPARISQENLELMEDIAPALKRGIKDNQESGQHSGAPHHRRDQDAGRGRGILANEFDQDWLRSKRLGAHA